MKYISCDKIVNWLVHNNLKRFGPMWMVLECSLFVIACLFWVTITMEGSAFNPEMWGTLAYALPAEAWAALAIIATMVTIVGLVEPPQRRMVTLGAAMSCVQYLVLSISAWCFDGQPIVGLYAGFLLLPLHAVLLMQGMIRDARTS